MSRNGTGVYSRAVADYVYDTVIDETAVNSEMDDIATALTQSIAKDGQTNPTANLPMATYRHTGVGNGSARTDYAAMGQVQDGKINWVDGGGTADAITAAYSPALTALVDGQLCFVRATAANATTTPSFSPNGLTARTIVKQGGGALVAGDIVGDGHELVLRYDLANTQWELLNPLISSIVAASDTAAGIVELATTAETTTGTDATRAVTPDGLHDMTSLAGAAWFLDEDNMASDSATKVSSQQAIKAYADGLIAALSPSAFTNATTSTTTGGASIAFTSLPTGLKEIELFCDGISWSGTQAFGVQLGDATTGDYVATGYTGYLQQATAAGVGNSTYFTLQSPGVAATAYTIKARFTKLTSAAHLWDMQSNIVASSGSGVVAIGLGKVTLAGAVDRFKIFAASDTIDVNGGVYLKYR